MIAGAQAMPSDLREAMSNMRVGGWLWWKRFALPAVIGLRDGRNYCLRRGMERIDRRGGRELRIDNLTAAGLGARTSQASRSETNNNC